MYSKLSASLDRLPLQRGCACLSLRTGCLVTGIITILYSVLALSLGLAELSDATAGTGAGPRGAVQWSCFVAELAAHAISLVLSTFMLVGTLREKPWMMRPWVVFKAVQLTALVLVFIVGSALRLADADHSALLLAAVQFFTILIWYYMLTVVATHERELEGGSQRAESARLKAIDDNWYTV